MGGSGEDDRPGIQLCVPSACAGGGEEYKYPLDTDALIPLAPYCPGCAGCDGGGPCHVFCAYDCDCDCECECECECECDICA